MDRARRPLAMCLAGFGWICAIWLASYVSDRWLVRVASSHAFGSGQQPGPSRLLLLAGVIGLLAWGIAYWLDRVSLPYLVALTQWLAATGICLIGLVSVRPLGLFTVPGHSISGYLSMYREALTFTDSWPLLILGLALCLPRLALAVSRSLRQVAADQPADMSNT